MDKKFYVTPEMEEFELKNMSMICESYNGSDPNLNTEEPDPDFPIITD